jgi:integrase
MAKPYKLGKKTFYRVDVWITLPTGQPHRYRRKRIPTREMAEILEAKALADSFEGKFFDKRKESKLTVKDAWALYEPVTTQQNDSWKSDVGRAKHILRHLGEKPAIRLTQLDVDAYRRIRKTEKTIRGEEPSPAQLDRELALLKRMLNYLVPAKLERNPLTGIKLLNVPNTRKVVLTDAQFDKLVACADVYLKPIILVAYDCGMRKEEVLGLRADQLSLTAGTITLSAEDTKTDEARTVHLTSRTIAALKALPRDIRSAYIFTNPKLRRDAEGREYRTRWYGVRRAWARASEAAGVPDAWFHDTRRSFATHMRKSGVPESVVMKMTGHKTREVFRRYNIVDDDDVREAVRRREESREREAVERQKEADKG